MAVTLFGIAQSIFTIYFQPNAPSLTQEFLIINQFQVHSETLAKSRQIVIILNFAFLI